MAIVGQAFVRLRVIGDKLKGDISDATKKAVNDAAPDLKASGEGAGEHVGEGLGDGVERGARTEIARIGDEIGDALGTAMGNSLGRSLRNRIGGAVRNGIAGGRTELNRAQDFFRPVSDKFEKFFGDKSKQFEGLFSKALTSGISLAVIALPSVLAFLGAGISAVAATAVTALSSLGPVAAGAAFAAIGAFTAIKASAGLIGLAMKQQTPALLDFQDRLDTFKTRIATPIQAGLLSGLNAAMRISQPTIAALQPQLTTLGVVVGDIAIRFADMLRQGENTARLQRIFAANNVFVSEAGRGATALGQAFLILLDHISPITRELGTLARQAGEWVLATIQAAEASGRLDAFITTTWGFLKYFVGILVDFAIGIWNVFSAAHAASGGMLTSLHDTAAAFREWTGDPENRDRMITFFEKMRTITAMLIGVFRQLAGAAGSALEGTNVDSFASGLNTLVSVGQSVADVFGQIRAAAGDQLQTMFSNLATLLTQLSNSGVIGTVTTALSNLFAIISKLLAIPGVGQLLAFGAGLLAIWKTVSLLWTVLGPVLSILWTLIEVVGGALVAAFGWIPVVIGLVVAALVWFFTQTEIGRAIIAAVWDFIKNAIGAAVDAIVAAWNWMVGIFQSVWQWISGIATAIWQAVSTAFNNVVTAVSTAIQAVWNWIVSVWTAIWGFIQPILQGIWSFISAVFDGIRTVIETVLNVILTIWSYIWPLLALPIRILYGVIILIWNAIYAFFSMIIGAIVDFVVWAWNGMVSGITTALQAIWDFISYIWNAIWGFIQPIIQGIVDFVVERWNNLVNNVKAALDWIWGIIKGVWDTIWGFIQPIIQTIVGFITDRWNNLVNNVRNAMNFVKDIISDVWNAITGFIGGAMDKIGGLISKGWDFVTNAGRAALDGIKSAVNVVIDAINWVIKGINWAIDLANKLPGPDIPNIPSIPRLARGGVVSPQGGGTLAMIAEAGHPERVEPLDPSGLSARDRALIDRLTTAGSGANVTVYIGTRELTELVDVVVEDREDRLGDRLSTGTKG